MGSGVGMVFCILDGFRLPVLRWLSLSHTPCCDVLPVYRLVSLALVVVYDRQSGNKQWQFEFDGHRSS